MTARPAPPPTPTRVTSPPGRIDLLYADGDVVVVDKPAGLLVHRGWARDRDVVMARVRDRLGQRVHPVHRLDRGASGAVAFARHPDAARVLCDAFAAGRPVKVYLALVRGAPPDRGVIDHPIPRAPGGPRVPAVTRFSRVAAAGRYAVVLARPHTGRLHQIRKHLKHIACPLIGDVKYGKGEHNRLFRDRHDLRRLALHAAVLALPPLLGDASRPVIARAPIPADLARALSALGVLDAAAAALAACARAPLSLAPLGLGPVDLGPLAVLDAPAAAGPLTSGPDHEPSAAVPGTARKHAIAKQSDP